MRRAALVSRPTCHEQNSRAGPFGGTGAGATKKRSFPTHFLDSRDTVLGLVQEHPGRIDSSIALRHHDLLECRMALFGLAEAEFSGNEDATLQDPSLMRGSVGSSAGAAMAVLLDAMAS